MTRLLKILMGMTIFVLSFIAQAQTYSDLTENQKFSYLLDSCNKNQSASCYEVSQWYKKNQRLDPVEEKKIRQDIQAINDKRKLGELSDDDKKSLIYSGTLLSEKNQKARATEQYKIYLNKACDSGESVACKERDDKMEYDGSFILYWTSLALIFLAVFLVAKTIFQDEDQFQAQEKLDDAKVTKEDMSKQDIVLRYSRPFFKRYFSPIVSGMKNKKGLKEKYRRKLASAGLTSILTPEDFFAYKLFLIIGFPIIFLGVRTFLEETWPLSLIPVLALIGFYYPDIAIKSAIQRRQQQVISSMPFCVDMLALSVEAGLDFIAAMQKVIEKAKRSALTEEFEILIREIRIGASRGEALRNLAWRVDLIQISSFCATLIAADSVGASIGPILKALSNEIRQKKSSEVEKKGATAATKILFPMMFLIIPAVLLIVFSPMIFGLIAARK